MPGSSQLDPEEQAVMLERTGLRYVRVQDNFPVANRKQRRAAGQRSARKIVARAK